jgi:hypothetical protein
VVISGGFPAFCFAEQFHFPCTPDALHVPLFVERILIVFGPQLSKIRFFS